MNEEQRKADTDAMIAEQIDEMTDSELRACVERVNQLGKEVEKLIDWREMVKDSVDNLSDEIQEIVKNNFIDDFDSELMVNPQTAAVNSKEHPISQEMDLKQKKLRVMRQIYGVQSRIYEAIVQKYDNQCPHCYDNFFQESEREYYELLQAMQIMLNKFGGGIAVVQYVPREYQRNWQIVEGK